MFTKWVKTIEIDNNLVLAALAASFLLFFIVFIEIFHSSETSQSTQAQILTKNIDTEVTAQSIKSKRGIIGAASNVFSKKTVTPFLYFPLADKSPFANTDWKAAEITSIFDHQIEWFYSKDGLIVPFTGELAEEKNILSQKKDDFAPGYANKYAINFNFSNKINYKGPQNNPFLLFYDGHVGIDFKTSREYVYAASDGILSLPKSDSVGGDLDGFNAVKIDHQNGYETWYIHLGRIDRSPGKIKRGDIIGVSGKAGAQYEHLHFELRYKGIPIDPYGWDPVTNAEVKVDPYKFDDIFESDNNYLQGFNFWTGKPATSQNKLVD